MVSLPIKIKRHVGTRGQTGGYIVTDARGRTITLMCEKDNARRDAAKLWRPEEAEALAKKIARLLTEDEEKAAATAAAEVV